MNSDPTTRKSMSEDWHFPTLAHVWDHQTKAIIAGADKLEALSAADRTRSLAALGEWVRAHTRFLDDSWLVATAFFMVEDLYKSYFRGFRWSSGVADYIAGSAGVFMREFTQRGFVLNYVIDNTESEADLGEMLTYLPEVFRAAGLLVVGLYPDVALSNRNAPGTIVVFRNQPPVAGTTAQVTPPPGVTLPTT
jgi:hypothetical protein